VPRIVRVRYLTGDGCGRTARPSVDRLGHTTSSGQGFDEGADHYLIESGNPPRSPRVAALWVAGVRVSHHLRGADPAAATQREGRVNDCRGLLALRPASALVPKRPSGRRSRGAFRPVNTFAPESQRSDGHVGGAPACANGDQPYYGPRRRHTSGHAEMEVLNKGFRAAAEVPHGGAARPLTRIGVTACTGRSTSARHTVQSIPSMGVPRVVRSALVRAYT